MSELNVWATFYIIVGSSAGALTGLTFVVVTLIAGSQQRDASRAVAAFSTPTVVHFCAVLFLSALLSAPWQGLVPLCVSLALVGLAGMGYVVVVARRLRAQESSYTLVFEDWLFHAALPLIAYIVLAVMPLLLLHSPTQALFGVGAAMALLLFTGIHNAWDALTYIAVEGFQPYSAPRDE